MKTRVLHHPGAAERPPAERPRGVEPARLNGRPGVAADVLRDLNAAAKNGPHQLPPLPQPRPFPALMADLGRTHAVCILADAVCDDISDLAEDIVDLIEPLKAVAVNDIDHTFLLATLARLDKACAGVSA